MRFWKPGDIYETQCPKCGANVEFFKDEVKRRCRCGHEIVNSKLDLGCAQWCPYAEQCLGAVPDEVKARQKAEEKNLLRERIALEMKKYFGTDFKRMNHALKVARNAEQILKSEGGNPLVVLGAAYLHDIGIHEAEKKHGSSSGHFQEMEGPVIAKEILGKLAVEQEIAGRSVISSVIIILPGIMNPSTFRSSLKQTGWSILKRKDYRRIGEKVQKIIEKAFKTVTGKRLAEERYLN